MNSRKPLVRFLLFAVSAAFFLGGQVQAKNFRTVVIDAGHGGKDKGGSYGKIYEKHLALDTSLRLARYLKERGIRVKMTRTSDYFIPLTQRAAIGNSISNSIFVSVHYNYTWKRHVSGLETFYYTSKSRALASYVQDRCIKKTRCNSRGVKFARYAVLRRSKNPAILVECGFVSNSYERNRMKTAKYRQAMAEGIGEGIIKYKKSRY